MKKNEYTKLLLATSFKELLQTVPLKRITVQNIVEHCGLNRGTFYYHFYEKQDLIHWIYHHDITEPTRAILQKDPSEWGGISLFGLELMLKDKKLYLQAIKEEGPNNLTAYIKNEITENWNILVQRYTEVFHSGKNSTELVFFAEFVANGAWATLIKWIDTGMRESPEVLSNLIDTIAAYSMEAVALRTGQAPSSVPGTFSS